jgi:hypothetical protein
MPVVYSCLHPVLLFMLYEFYCFGTSSLEYPYFGNFLTIWKHEVIIKRRKMGERWIAFCNNVSFLENRVDKTSDFLCYWEFILV